MNGLTRPLLIAALAFCTCAPSWAEIYAVTRDVNSVLYEIDPVTQTHTAVGPTGVSHLTGLAYHADMGVMFAHQPYDSFDPAALPGRQARG